MSANPEAAPVLNEKHDSKYYHFGTTDPETAKMYVPQKIENEAPKAAAASGLSGWNANGTTWEDRDMFEWAQRALKDQFHESSIEVDGAQIDIKVNSVEGEASIVYSRGRPRIGFDVTIKSTFKGSINGADVSGEITLENLDEMTMQDEDYEMDLTCGSDVKKVVRAALKAPVHERLEAFVVAFKQQ